MKKILIRGISILLALALMLSFVPMFRTEARAVTVNQQNIADRADFFFNTTWVCQKNVNAWRDEFVFQKGETYHLPYGQPVNSGKFIGYGVELEDFLMAAADADSVFYSRQSEFNGWTSVYYATDCAAFVAMCWGTVRQDCSTLPYYSTYKGKPTESNIYSILQLGDALDSTSVGHVVLVSDLIYNTDGELIQIEITEQTPPQLKRTYFTPSELAAKYGEEFGIYRYEGSVPAVPEWGYTTECTNYAAYGMIDVTDDTPIMSLPCSSAVQAESVRLSTALKGEVYTATRLYNNTANEFWYRIALEKDNVGYIQANSTLYQEMLLDDITLTDAVYPNAHVKGKTFSLVGNLYSRYNQLVTASAYIYQGFGTDGNAITGATDYVTGNSYTLKSSQIDYDTSFGDLTPGNHTMSISASYRNYYVENGDVIEQSGTLELAQEYFVVIASSTSQSSCNHRYTQTVLALGSCTQTGLSVFACSSCGKVYKQSDAAIGHTFGDWSITDASCTQDGAKTRTCTVCGEVETNILHALGHQYSEEFLEGNCTECPHYVYTCAACGDYYTIYPEEVMGPWQEAVPEEVDPALVETKTQYRCSDLKIIVSADQELAGHTYLGETWETVKTETLDYVKQFPSGFDSANTLYAQYRKTPGTESENDIEKVIIDSDNVTGYLYYHWCYDNSYFSQATQSGRYTTFHAYYSTTKPDSYRVDTSDNSYCTAHETCSNTDWYFIVEVNTQSISTQHKMYLQGQWQEFGEWTDLPIEAGDTRQVETRTLYRWPDLREAGHQYETTETAPTCTKPGMTVFTCTLCGDRYEAVLPALGHSYDTVTVEATCTAEGSVIATCAICGDVQIQTIPTIGHSYETVTVEATCTDDGSVTDTCAICGDTQVQIIPATGHHYEVTVTEPNCTEKGYTTYTCSCGDSYTSNEKAPLGHRYETVSIDATCTADGSITEICTTCGDTQVQIIPATGHRFEITVIAPTCTQSGYTTYTCDCGHSVTVNKVDALGHSYNRTVIEKTCTEDGSVTEICQLCGDTQVQIIPATGHQHTAVVTAPTCTENGYTTYTCNCGDSYVGDETIATGHDYQMVMTDATCTEDGSISATCSSCNDTKVGIIPATGHSYENGTCVTCGESEPVEVTKPTITLKSPTLEFKDMICIVAFYTAENTQDVVEMGMITYKEKVSNWSIETADYVIPGATYDETSGRYYSSSQGIHAKYLSETVYLACYTKLTDGSYVYTKLAPYSPITYANSQLKNSGDAKLKQLVVAMLNYGAEAQLYFGHNVDNLANAGLTWNQLALPESYRADMVQPVPSVSVDKQGIFANNAGFSGRKPAISFEGAFCINYFFTPKYVPADGITLYYWDESDFNSFDVLTAENATGSLKLEGNGTEQYRGDISGISAKDLAQATYVAAVYSDGTATWTSGVLGYSIGAYCSSQASKGGDVADLAMATAVYGYHAKQYFA